MSGDFGKMLGLFFVMGVIFGLIVFGAYLLVDWLWIDDSIKSTTIITPKIELVIKNNVIDTVYVYKKP